MVYNKMLPSTGMTTRVYDQLNRTVSKTAPGSGTSTFGYDVTANMPTDCIGEITTDSKGNVNTKVFDKAGRLYQIIVNGATTTYAYFDNGNLQTVTYPNNLTEEYTYYADNSLHTLANRRPGSIINAYNYAYDACGNILTKLDNSGTTTYTYDALNRLASVTAPGGKVTTYTFDASGNRATQQVTDSGKVTNSTYTYNTQNELLSAADIINGKTTMTSYCYDDNGNAVSSRKETTDTTSGEGSVGLTVTGSGDATYTLNTYDVFNQLTKTQDQDSTAAYTYNGDGLRVGKTVTKDNTTTTTNFVYEYDKVVLELDGSGNQTAYNAYGGDRLISRTAGGATIYYLYNGHGDVVNLTDDTGAVVMTYDYDVFGVVTTATGSVANSYLYAGYQFDDETGMYYLNARYYDPVTARFMSADTYLGMANDPLSLNLYTYCINNPIKYTDPTGHWQERDSMLSTEKQALINAATAEYNAAKASGDIAAMEAAHNAAEAVRDGANASLRDLTAASEGTVDSYNNTTKTATVTVNGVTQTFTIGDGTNGTYAVINGHIIMNNNQFDLLFTKCDQGVFTTTSQVVDTNVTAATVSATVTTTKIQYWGLGVTTTVSTSGTTVANSFYKSTTDVVRDDNDDTSDDSAVPASVQTLVNMTSRDERFKYLFGDEDEYDADDLITRNDYKNSRFYKTQEEAGAHMTKIKVNVWTYNANGNKVASTMSLTVNAKIADMVACIFEKIFNDPEQFAFNKAETAGYNWRYDYTDAKGKFHDGGTPEGQFSEHSHGIAIDINYGDNPLYDKNGNQLTGRADLDERYAITSESSVYKIFKKYGWDWGGDWTSSKDYMHFEWSYN